MIRRSSSPRSATSSNRVPHAPMSMIAVSFTSVDDVSCRRPTPIGGRGAVFAGLVLACLVARPLPAQADLRMCNQTGSKVGIALGYRDGQGWVTEGWWDVAPKGCETLLRGALASRFYYVFAVDYTRGGERNGRSSDVHQGRRVHDPRRRGLPRPRVRSATALYEVDSGEQEKAGRSSSRIRASRRGRRDRLCGHGMPEASPALLDEECRPQPA